jgi:exonuclease VII small subunit
MTPEFIAFAIGVLALVGCACAFVACQQVVKEQEHLVELENSVNNPSKWVEVYQQSAKKWLISVGLPLDSHAANLLVAVRGGWGGGKLPTNGELHAVIVRRERSRVHVRLASGIAATLLIFGIAGTLLGIHPLLTDFKIGTAADGTVQEASTSAKNVTNLVSGLGRAFLPSLTALVGTLLVVIFRGWYVHNAHKLAQSLDLFSADTLLPAFRISTQEEVMAGVKDRLTQLTNKMEERDMRFATAVQSLEVVISRLEERTPALEDAISSVAKASETLATNTDSVSNALDRNFGPDSSSTKSLILIESLSGKISDSFTELSKSSATLNSTTNSATRKLSNSADKLAVSAKELPIELKTSVSQILGTSVKALEDVTVGLVDARTNLESAVTENLVSIKSTVSGQLEILNSSVKVATEHLQSSIEAGTAKASENLISNVTGITESLNRATAEQIKVLDSAVEGFSEHLLSTLQSGVEKASHKMSILTEAASANNSTQILTQVAEKIDSTVDATTRRIEPLLSRLEDYEKSLALKIENPIPPPVQLPVVVGPDISPSKLT